jgi:hypothetical protein
MSIVDVLSMNELADVHPVPTVIVEGRSDELDMKMVSEYLLHRVVLKETFLESGIHLVHIKVKWPDSGTVQCECRLLALT